MSRRAPLLLWFAALSTLVSAGRFSHMIEDREQVMERVNAKRCLHGSQPLTWSDSLGSQMAVWLNKGCTSYTRTPVNELKSLSVGELIFSQEFNGSFPVESYFMQAAVDAWYDGLRSYSFGTAGPGNSMAQDFVQLVWNATTSVACKTCINNNNNWVNVGCWFHVRVGELKEDYVKNVFEVVECSTPAPATKPPMTEAPETAEPSAAPLTEAPPTSTPPTLAPTEAPSTASPETDSPPTGPPATPAPATEAPATNTPTVAPDTTHPATPAPLRTSPPSTNAPETARPSTKSPPATAEALTSPPDTAVPATVALTDHPATLVPTPAEDTAAPPTAAPPAPTPAPYTKVPVGPGYTAQPLTKAPPLSLMPPQRQDELWVALGFKFLAQWPRRSPEATEAWVWRLVNTLEGIWDEPPSPQFSIVVKFVCPLVDGKKPYGSDALAICTVLSDSLSLTYQRRATLLSGSGDELSGDGGVYVEFVLTDASQAAVELDVLNVTQAMDAAAEGKGPLYSTSGWYMDKLALHVQRFDNGATLLKTQSGPVGSKYSPSYSVTTFEEPEQEVGVHWAAYSIVGALVAGFGLACSSLLVVKRQKRPDATQGILTVSEFYRTMPEACGGPIPEEHYCVNGREDADVSSVELSSLGSRNVSGFGYVQPVGRI
ncbi:hypothetical protein DIPPA_35208 [Diplonema papillatum]|nr:hypothetical protein DIPPA_35208 [Diplonema papillatum]